MGRLGTFALAAVIALSLPALGDRMYDTLAGMERFRVERVEVEGMRYLDRDEVEGTLGLSPRASVWDDPARWEERIEEHPLVRSARIRRRLPSTLVVRLEERTPVALLASSTLEPVDVEGRVLPVDPAVHRLDLPLLRVPGAAGDADEGSHGARGHAESLRAMGGWSVGTGSRPVRVLAGEAARLAEATPSFVSMLSELEWTRTGEVMARWGDPDVVIRFRPPLAAERVREGMAVLTDAATRHPERSVESVDLRFADQVVVRFRHEGTS